MVVSKEFTCRRIYSGSKSFWKRQTAVDLSIFEHRKTQEQGEIGMTFLSPLRRSKEQVDDVAIIELVVFDPDNGVEQHLFMSGKLLFGKVSGAFNQRGQAIRVQQFSSYANSLISKYIYARVDLVADGNTGKIVTLVPLADDIIDEHGRLDIEMDKPSTGLGVLPVVAQYRRFKTEDWDATVEQFNHDVSAVSKLRQISSDALDKTKELIEEAEDISGVLYKKTTALENTVSKLRQISSEALGEDEEETDDEDKKDENNQNLSQIRIITELQNQTVPSTIPTPHQPTQRPSPAGQPKHRRGMLTNPTSPSNNSNLPMEGTSTNVTTMAQVPTSSSTGTSAVLIPPDPIKTTPSTRHGVVTVPPTHDSVENDHDHDHNEQDDVFDDHQEFDDDEEDDDEEEEDEGFDDQHEEENEEEGEIRQSESTLPTPTPSESQTKTQTPFSLHNVAAAFIASKVSANAAAAAAAGGGKRKKSIEVPPSAGQGTKKSMGGGVISMLVSAVSAAIKGNRQRSTSPTVMTNTMPAVRTTIASTNAANRPRSPAGNPSVNNSKGNSRNNTPLRVRRDSREVIRERDITPQRRLEKKTTNGTGRRPIKTTKTRTASFVTGNDGQNQPQPPTGAPPSRQKKNPITIGRFHTADF